MSWQAAAYGILALVLLGGFAWYERSRPPSQIVALVAAMAALAVAGRVAFPVLPNVVATTDIVFFTGYAIGGAPGFVVGALAGLVSNFWLGQGPWTPWQMAGWGLVGIAGAATATLTRRRLNRFGLAACCGIAGILFGALMDSSLMFTYGGDQSLARFLAISSVSLPFNLAHATGNIVIALAAGPALVRMLTRFKERFEVEWSPQPAVLLIGFGVSVALALPSPAAKAAGQGSAVNWLKGVQNADGGFGPDPGADSDASMTGWAALGLEAAGVNPLDLAKGGKTPVSYLRENAREVRSLGDLERTILVLRGAGLGARGFGGRNLVRDLRRARDPDGSFDRQVNLTAFGVLALDAAGAGSNARSASWLVASQNDDGGWGFQPDSPSDADSTGAVIQALAAAGGNRAAIGRGVGFLRNTQRPGGGFPLLGGAVNSQSTAWAVQGLVAAGRSPDSLRRGGTALGYLDGLRAADGHYRYAARTDQTPVWVTGQALLAVNRTAFPIRPVGRSTSSKSANVPDQNAAVAQSAPDSAGKGKAGKERKRKTPPPPPPPAEPAAPAAPEPIDLPGEPVKDAKGVGKAPLAAGLASLAALLIGGGWFLRRRRASG